MIKYGLISELDSKTLEKTIDLICKDFPLDYWIKVTEVGLFNCETSKGIMEYITSDKCGKCVDFTGIDNEKDKEIPFKYQSATHKEYKVIIGNSNEVYNALADNSQHLIFQDGCHALPCVISDFFCYAGKVKVGGYMAFHDTGKHIKPFKDWQRMGSEGDADMYISVRKALNHIGLLQDANNDLSEHRYFEGWKLIFDEADPTDSAGGICVFKKLY